MADDELRRDLLAKITARRVAIQAYLRHERPRTRRRATATMVLTSLAAIFTAGPAAGGESFSGSVSRTLGLPAESLVWRVLCLAALAVSVAAAVLTSMDRAQDAVARLSVAEAVSAQLEGLETLLQFGSLAVADAVKLYHEYISKIPYVDGLPIATTGGSATR